MPQSNHWWPENLRFNFSGAISSVNLNVPHDAMGHQIVGGIDLMRSEYALVSWSRVAARSTEHAWQVHNGDIAGK